METNLKSLSKCHMSDIQDLTKISNQNIMRLCINRISLINTINVEHIMNYLCKQNVLNQSDKESILSQPNGADRVKCLLDIIILKDKDTNWYKHFRDSLKHPECDSASKKKYDMLVTFLDNSIISINKSKESHAGPDSESKSSEDSEKPVESDQDSNQPDSSSTHLQEKENSAADRKAFKQRLKAIKSIELDPPKAEDSIFTSVYENMKKSLKSCETHVTDNLSRHEKRVFSNMLLFETAYNSKRKGILGDEFYISFSRPFQKILKDVKHRHLYFKYFQIMESLHLIPVIRELVVSFQAFVKSAGEANNDYVIKQIFQGGLFFFEFLRDYGQYIYAEEVMNIVQIFLSTRVCLETLVPAFLTNVKLMESRTLNMEFREADCAYYTATELSRQIDLMSFGQCIYDKGRYMAEVCHLTLAQGFIQTGYEWARTALQNCDTKNCFTLLQVLHQNLLAYTAKWNGPRAEKLAVFQVQYAWSKFGEFSTQYLQSLLDFVAMSNLFNHDDFGILVATRAVSFAELIFGCDTPLLAHAYLQLARALIVGEKFDDEQFAFYSERAFTTALSCFPDTHPVVTQYRLVQGESYLCRAIHCSSNDIAVKNCFITSAEVEILKALRILETRYGDKSIVFAKSRMLLVKLNIVKQNYEEAKKIYFEIYEVYKAIMFPKDHEFLHFQVVFAKFLHDNNLEESHFVLELLKNVVESTECYGSYIAWVNEAFQLGSQITEDKSTWNEKYSSWSASHKLDKTKTFTWEMLHEKPHTKSFLKRWNLWKKGKKAILKQLRNKAVDEPNTGEEKQTKGEKEKPTRVESSSGTEDSDADSSLDSESSSDSES